MTETGETYREWPEGTDWWETATREQIISALDQIAGFMGTTLRSDIHLVSDFELLQIVHGIRSYLI